MVNDKTREYSVYISNEHNSVQGSGVLFYAGGDSMFVFTCAHVVDSLEIVRLFILKEINAKTDLYNVYCTDVPTSQIVYSPLDEVQTDDFGEKTHTEDIAIIQVKKSDNIKLSKTDYVVTETYRKQSVYVQGYPNGVPEGKKTIEYLDCLHGSVVVNAADSNKFTIRMDDSFIDTGSRICELEGLSGAPVWDDTEEVNGLLGLFTSAYDTTALLSKTYVTKAQQIRSIMKERFGVVIERKLEGFLDDDIAGSSYPPIKFDGSMPPEKTIDFGDWIEKQLLEIRLIIEDLKLQKAIEKIKALVDDPRYGQLSKGAQRKVKRYLLYCYEIADMDDEFEQLELEMRESSLIKEHDTLRQFTHSFMKRHFQETVSAAQHCIDTWKDSARNGSERDSLLSFAKAFLHLAKAYTENLPVEETIGKLLDEHENFAFPTEEIEDEALIYQMIGYVYGEHYHDYVNSVRFLNRSYSIGYDSMVLETLGAAYYNLGVYDATDENGRIPDWRKIDKKALYKARECYLIIKGKADELFWAGTMHRMGLCVYNTFVFLQDNYRILTIYQDIKKYLSDLTDEEWRDVEMKYARISAQKGEINVKEFKHITIKDAILIESLAKASKCVNLIENITADVPAEQIRGMSPFAREIRDTTRYLENSVRRIERRERVPIYVLMINLYGRGMQLFGWDEKSKLQSLYERLSEFADSDLLESMGNFIFEMSAPLEDSIKRFKATFEKRKNITTWQELNHLYIRHGMFDQADTMYKELFSERKGLIEEGLEYAYRAFMDYVTLYKRDLKYAIQCYLDAKEAFKDTDIEGFWELELMLYSSSFNTPERFEIERKHFMEKGLVTEESYHRAAFIAYFTNLNDVKALEHINYIGQCPHFLNPQTGMVYAGKEEILFYNWVRALAPNFMPPPDSMMEQRAKEIWKRYQNETWHTTIDKTFKNEFGLSKTIAIDTWSLYQLAEKNMLDKLEMLDRVYVSHMSVIRFLEELSRTDNQRIRIILNYLKVCNKIHIYSPEFKAQMAVRNVAQYTEPASTVAVAVEKDCIAVYGDPIVDDRLVRCFGVRMIRISQLEELMK